MRIRRTTLLILGCCAFLIGLWVSIKVTVPPAVVVFLLLAAIFFRRKQQMVLLFMMLIGLTLGIVRGNMFLPKVQQFVRLNNEKVVMRVVAESDAVYDQHKQLSFDAAHLQLIEPDQELLIGRMKIAGFGETAVYKGDTLLVHGKLYKTRGSKQASISYSQLELIQRDSSRIDTIRREFAAGLSNTLPDPQAPFGLGLLIGQRSTLGEEVTEWLATVGLTHIIAVSGYNLTIIVIFVHQLMAGRSRYQTLLVTSGLVWLFLLMTGFSASIVRAAIVCSLGLIAWYFGYRFRPLLLLLLTACITAGWYPVYLWSDIGWYLSFLAFFGVLILAPLVVRRFCKKEPKAIGMVVIETLCAQIMTLPLILYIFNEISLIALVSNMLIIPLVPLAMFCTLIAGLVGMFFPGLLGVLALPARILLTYILEIARLLSEIPHVLVAAQISVFVMLGMYGTIAVFCIVTWKATIQSRGIITEKNMI